jgi:amino acid permease
MFIKIIRIIALLGNIVGIIGVIYVSFANQLSNYKMQTLDYLWLISLMIFFFLNILFILSGNKNDISLYFQRKRLEEEIKIQEAENKLRELQNKK